MCTCVRVNLHFKPSFSARDIGYFRCGIPAIVYGIMGTVFSAEVHKYWPASSGTARNPLEVPSRMNGGNKFLFCDGDTFTKELSVPHTVYYMSVAWCGLGCWHWKRTSLNCMLFRANRFWSSGRFRAAWPREQIMLSNFFISSHGEFPYSFTSIGIF